MNDNEIAITMTQTYKWSLPEFPSVDSIDKNLNRIKPFPVVITEKINGTHFRVILEYSKPGWTTRFGSKEKELHISDKYFFNGEPQKYILNNIRNLFFNPRDLNLYTISIFGEWAGAGVMKEVEYGAPSFYVFEVRFDNEILPWNRMVNYCDYVGLKTVPLLYKGIISSIEQLEEIKSTDSILGLENGILGPNKMEGIVIKIEHPEYDFIDVKMAKFKNERFSEKKKLRLEEKLKLGEAAAFAEEYATIGRLYNIISYGYNLTNKRTDLKYLIDRTINDIIKEEPDAYKDVIYKAGARDVKTAIGRKIASLYEELGS